MAKPKNIKTSLLPVFLQADKLQVLIVGGGEVAFEKLQSLTQSAPGLAVTVLNSAFDERIRKLASSHSNILLAEKELEASDVAPADLLIDASETDLEHKEIKAQSILHKVPVHIAGNEHGSDFQLGSMVSRNGVSIAINANGKTERLKRKVTDLLNDDGNTEQKWRRIATRSIIVFALMLLGHIIISYLPLPGFTEIWSNVKEYVDYTFLLFVLAGFLAQMVDGVLSMGYGVTSATCLMSIGVNPVAVSAAIHTSEIFTSGISGYSHYKFGNVNKKLFKHLVIPGVIGAILGAAFLVFLGEKAGNWLMPIIAVYAMFLGFKILARAFQKTPRNTKVKRVGWLAWVGGFFDSFGGGGWGPIVTSTLIAKGRSPKYTIGSVSLTEFFITLASALTFFVTAGIGHWNVVIGLLIGGMIAAPFAAKLAGKLPRKTIMIAVGIMVIIWCIRLLIKSVF